LFYGTGDYLHNTVPYTTLSFQNLTRFALQGHDVTEHGGGCDGCEFGTIALDTDGHGITGNITKLGIDSATIFNFPEGFTADRLVFDFKQTGSLSGRLATIGGLTCPSGTQILVPAGDETGRVCNGDLT
jgi:hypothetical protein